MIQAACFDDSPFLCFGLSPALSLPLCFVFVFTLAHADLPSFHGYGLVFDSSLVFGAFPSAYTYLPAFILTYVTRLTTKVSFAFSVIMDSVSIFLLIAIHTHLAWT